jgi:hypothetical protein
MRPVELEDVQHLLMPLFLCKKIVYNYGHRTLSEIFAFKVSPIMVLMLKNQLGDCRGGVKVKGCQLL